MQVIFALKLRIVWTMDNSHILSEVKDNMDQRNIVSKVDDNTDQNSILSEVEDRMDKGNNRSQVNYKSNIKSEVKEEKLHDYQTTSSECVCYTTFVSKTHRMTWIIKNIDSVYDCHVIQSQTFPEIPNCSRFYVQILKDYFQNTERLIYSFFKCGIQDQKLTGRSLVHHRPMLTFHDGGNGVEEKLNENSEFVIHMTSEWRQRFVKDGVLKVDCSVRAFSCAEPLNCSVPKQVWPERSLRKDLKALLNDGTYSDIEVEVDGETFKAHRNILCTRSSVFKAMLAEPKALNGVVKLQGMSPYIAKGLLEFVYTGQCNVSSLTTEMMSAADKYGLLELKRLIESYLSASLNNHNVLPHLVEAMQCSAEHLQSSCLNYIVSRKLTGTITELEKWKELNVTMKLTICEKLLKL